jgi:hypothetical protein
MYPGFSSHLSNPAYKLTRRPLDVIPFNAPGRRTQIGIMAAIAKEDLQDADEHSNTSAPQSLG